MIGGGATVTGNRGPMGQIRQRVIFVEDEPVLAESVSATLNPAGFVALPPVTRAAEAESAVARGRPDVVLVDIRLDHGVDGIDLARRLHERFTVPVLFVSAYTDLETVQRAAGLHPSGFIVKPFHPEQLLQQELVQC